MFRKLLIFPYIIVLFFFIVGCSQKLTKYERLLDGSHAKPKMLTLHRDSVRVTVEGILPISFLTKDTKIFIYPEYRYGEGALRLGEIKAFDGEFRTVTNEVRYSADYIFPYLPGMEKGELVIKGVVESRRRTYQSADKLIAEGLEVSPLLTRIDQVIPNEPIPEIGIMMMRDFSNFKKTELREFEVPFQPGSTERRAPELPVKLRDFLNLGPSGTVVTGIKVIGLHSPATKDLIPGIAQKRAEFVAERLKTRRNFSNVPITVEYRQEDLFDLRVMLADYPRLDEKQKEQLYDILSSQMPYNDQLDALRKFPFYRNLSNDLFPRLSMVRVVFEEEDPRFSDLEISASVFSLINTGQSLEGLTEEHLIYAAQNAVRLSERAAIYLKLTELYPSVLAHNNLGVVYLNQAQRELETREKNVLISQALNQLRQANKMQNNPVSLHNIGRAYILRGDLFEAYIAISEASALERSEEKSFLLQNEGVRGALDILNGDYKLATIRLNRAAETGDNLFNRGLAYYLTQEYALAEESFESSVQINRESGYGFYGLALIAAQVDNRESLIENLGKSISSNEYLKQKALVDINFKSYLGDEDFVGLFR